ncbi:glutathione peroxidase [Flavitalea flava]
MYTFLFSLLSLFSLTDIYSISIPSLGGGAPIHLNAYRGKKILIVNTASSGLFTKQYGSLEQLYQQYKDSLVVIACPSNDFNNETGSEQDIQNLVTSTYPVHFLLAGKITVTGAGQSPLYQWLVTGSQNGGMSSTVMGDFQKYLIAADGHLIGLFAGAVDPMNDDIQQAIQQQ